MTGHVWLSPGDLRRLTDEMVVQGMPWPGDRLSAGEPVVRISAAEVEEAIAPASPEPATLDDPKLWSDWLAFLEGASRRGGLIVHAA
jgi:hypothetical protein